MALTATHKNPSQPYPASTPKSPSPSSSSSPISSASKLKTLIQTFIISHVCRFVRAISKARSILIRNFRKNYSYSNNLMFYPTKATKNQKKIFFGSFRLHYNWCSSNVVPATVLDQTSHLYYDSNSNSVVSDGIERDEQTGQLSGYLQWLEENVENKFVGEGNGENEMNEIDWLADMFIADCHEKFRLEKVESYRRFQEMLARGL